MNGIENVACFGGTEEWNEREREGENTHERTSAAVREWHFSPERSDGGRKTGRGKTNLRVARMTFQQCGRLEQLLTEYCNHYVSICHAGRLRLCVPVSRSLGFKKMIAYRCDAGIDNRLALQIENHSRNAANQTVSTWNLISTLPPAASLPPSYATRVSIPLLAGPRNDDTTTDRPPTIRYRAALFFLPSVGSICFAISIRARLRSARRANRMRSPPSRLLSFRTPGPGVKRRAFNSIVSGNDFFFFFFFFLFFWKGSKKAKLGETAETINATVKVASVSI